MYNSAIKAACFAGFLLSMLSSPSLAAAICYEEKLVNSSLQCGNNSSRSADFSASCKYEEAKIEKVEVECPDAWVNITTSMPSQSASQTCRTAGMVPTSIDGATCAAGEKRPTSGKNVDAIRYRFGKLYEESGGGSNIIIKELRIAGSEDQPNGVSEEYYYCYGENKRDFDATDMAVAYACKTP